MKNKLAETLVLAFYSIVAVCSVTAFVVVLSMTPTTRKVPCSVAEISPDVTQQEREQCRQIRGHKL